MPPIPIQPNLPLQPTCLLSSTEQELYAVADFLLRTGLVAHCDFESQLEKVFEFAGCSGILGSSDSTNETIRGQGGAQFWVF